VEFLLRTRLKILTVFRIIKNKGVIGSFSPAGLIHFLRLLTT